MPYSLNGQVVLVTGAASGIGASIVKQLLGEDVKHIIILDIAEEVGINLQNELNAACKENKVTFIECDVSDKQRLLDAYQRVGDEIGYIDVVINNAGIFYETPEVYEKEIAINVTALITSSMHAWRRMHKQKGGSGGTIINFSSITAISKFEYMPIYSATKSAVLKFSTTLGSDGIYSKSGVRILTLTFAATDTPIISYENVRPKVFDESAQDDCLKHLAAFKKQSPESAAKAVIAAYKQGASGSVWFSGYDKPSVDVTDAFNKSIEVFDDYVFNNY